MKIEWFADRVINRVEDSLQDQEYNTAKKVFEEARRRAPVGDTIKSTPLHGKSWQSRYPGKLKESIKMYRSKYPDGGFIVVAGDKDAYYARFVELGTPGRTMRVGSKKQGSYREYSRTPIPKNPFLRGALESQRRRFIQLIKDLFR